MTNNQSRLLKYLNEIKKYKEFFKFYPDICTTKDIIKNLNNEIKIIHKNCNHETIETLSHWIKNSPYRANRLKFFESNDINLVCPQCCTKEIQKKVDYLYNEEFKIINLFVNTKTKLEIKHIDCNQVFSASYETLMSGKMKCKSCKKNNTFDKNSKQQWLLNKLKEKDIHDIIPQEQYKGYNEKIVFKHLKCNNVFSETPNNLFRRKNKCPYCNQDEFIINSSDKKLEKDRLNIANKRVYEYHGNKFKLLKINSEDKMTVSLRCLTCNNDFVDYRTKLYTNKLICPHCNITMNKFISTKDKINTYNKQLRGKFIILEGFTNQNEKIKIKRVSCGHTIKKSLNDILSPKYKDTCLECDRLKRFENANIRLKEKYNNRFEVLNGIDNYKNTNTILLFLDNKCGNKFSSSFNNILNNKYFKCPSCEIKNETLVVKSEVYNKFKGEYLMIGDYIDSKTPIKFKHTKCNHIFFKTKYKFFNSKTPCNECRREARSLGMKNAQKKVNNKFKKLFTLKGIYVNSKSRIPVLCNNCNHVEEISLNNLLKRNSCIKCNSQSL